MIFIAKIFSLLASWAALANGGSQEEMLREFSVSSAANFEKVDAERGHSIKQPGHIGRIALSSGTTLMQEVKVEAGSQKEHSTIRREEKFAQGTEGVSSSSAGVRTKKTSFKDGPGVTWNHCTDGHCICDAKAGVREMVIRFMQMEEAYPNDQRSYENSWYRQYYPTDQSYTHTPAPEFKKGFPDPHIYPYNSHNGDFPLITPYSLQQCGGWNDDAVDCNYKPQNCTFPDRGSNSNPYDAQEGQYCCDPYKKYCSYRCVPGSTYTFKCPESAEENNLPGGLNPAVNKTKACYIASYCAGRNPMSVDDTYVCNCCGEGIGPQCKSDPASC